jgi:hypothetical protein
VIPDQIHMEWAALALDIDKDKGIKIIKYAG